MTNFDERQFTDALTDVEDEIRGEQGVYEEDGASDEAFTIYVMNASSTQKCSLDVYGDNTLGQVLDSCRETLGLKEADNKIRFRNASGDSTADLNMSVEEFAVKPESILSISQDGKVAADFDDALSEAEDEIRREQDEYEEDGAFDEAFTIYVMNASSTQKCSLDVYGDNTLGQVLDSCRETLGLKEADNKIRFRNASGDSTADLNMSVEEFAVKPESILSISQDGKVACGKIDILA